MARRPKKIKPCPFCGGEAEVHTSYENPDVFNVRCTQCFARTGWHHTPENAVRAWNARWEPEMS